MPGNFIHVRTGLILNKIDSIGFNIYNYLSLMVIGLLVLIPTFFTKKIQIDK